MYNKMQFIYKVCLLNTNLFIRVFQKKYLFQILLILSQTSFEKNYILSEMIEYFLQQKFKIL